MTDFKIFLASDAGKSAQYQARRNKRVQIHIDGIEPQSKKMALLGRTAFQQEVAAL